MAALLELPAELILHIVSFLTREITIDSECRLREYYKPPEWALVPDLPSINALSQTNIVFHGTFNRTIYSLCASVEPLGRLALLFAVEHELERAVDKLVAAGISLDGEFSFGGGWTLCSLLHIAAAQGLQAMVRKLLQMCRKDMIAWVHLREENNRTALDYAAGGGHLEIVQLLAPIPMPDCGICNGVSPGSDRFETREQYLSIALMESATEGHLEISQYLVSEGADVNFLRERFYIGTALFLAARTKNLVLVQFLLASGADPNLHTSHGVTPIHNAADVDVGQVLLEAGADIHVTTEFGRNVLAYHTADVELLRFSLERGVDPNNVDAFGQTPLHYVFRQPCDAHTRVKLLLRFGAETVEKADDQGKTPLDLAIGLGSSEVVKLLEPFVQDPDLKVKIASWREEREEGATT